MEIPAGFVMPDFGNTPAATGRRKMAFICSKGNLDMAYPALIMGNAALGEGFDVHIFFTFWGLDIINIKTNYRLKFTMAGNTAMHMPELARVRPGLEHVGIPQALGNVPGMTSMATAMMKRQMKDLGIPEVPQFLDLLQDLGAHMYACRLTFDMMKLNEYDLHPGVEGVINAADFIGISEGAQIVFI